MVCNSHVTLDNLFNQLEPQPSFVEGDGNALGISLGGNVLVRIQNNVYLVSGI